MSSNKNSTNYVVRTVLGIIFGVAELLLVARLVLKLLAANPLNTLVKGIYDITQYVVGIFEGIFANIAVGGAGSTAVLDVAALIALVVVAIVGGLLMRLTARRG